MGGIIAHVFCCVRTKRTVHQNSRYLSTFSCDIDTVGLRSNACEQHALLIYKVMPLGQGRRRLSSRIVTRTCTCRIFWERLLRNCAGWNEWVTGDDDTREKCPFAVVRRVSSMHHRTKYQEEWALFHQRSRTEQEVTTCNNTQVQVDHKTTPNLVI